MKKTALAIFLILVFQLSLSTQVIEALSSEENSWTTVAPLPQTSPSLGTVAVNGKIYVMGGTINYEYNPSTNTWATKTPMPTPRFGFGIAAYQDKIYTIGGSNNDSFNANEVYDPFKDIWETKAPFPESTHTSNLEANVVDGIIYMIGGCNDKWSNYSVNEMYDVARDSWTNKTTMPYPVYGCASAVVDNKIYFIGGYGSLLCNQTQIYDPRTDSWKLGTPIPTGVRLTAGASTTGKMAPKRIYVVGGCAYNQSLFFDSTYINQVYDPKNDNWTVGAPMPAPRLGLNLVAANDQIYAIAGQTHAAFAGPLTLVERYTPLGYGTSDPSYAPPEIILISPKNETYYKTSIPIEISANEAASWIRYKLDNETVNDLLGNTILTGLSRGSHIFTVYAADESGNEEVSQTIQFEVTDEPAPFPTTTVATAFMVAVAVIGSGLLVYFRKRKRPANPAT
jgi:N-acetylneuraminic acid mutarotase